MQHCFGNTQPIINATPPLMLHSQPLNSAQTLFTTTQSLNQQMLPSNFTDQPLFVSGQSVLHGEQPLKVYSLPLGTPAQPLIQDVQPLPPSTQPLTPAAQPSTFGVEHVHFNVPPPLVSATCGDQEKCLNQSQNLDLQPVTTLRQLNNQNRELRSVQGSVDIQGTQTNLQSDIENVEPE